jgi:two-component system, sensor histidine kinase
MDAAAEAFADRVRAAQVEAAYRGSLPGTLGSVFAAAALTLILIHVGTATPIVGTVVVATIAASAAARLLLVRAYRRAKPNIGQWRLWANRFTASALFGGLAWGAGALWLMPAGRLDLELMVMVVVFAVASGAVSAFGAHLPAFLVNFVPMVGLAFLRLGAPGDVLHVALAALGPVWMVVIVALARQYNANVAESLRLRFENLDLVANLQREKEAAEQQRALAEQANLAKSRFLASASHDLRQPVHALGLFVGALRGRPLDAEAQRLVEHIDGSVTAMDGLFAALLDISRLDAGVTQPRLAAVPVGPLLERICRDHQAEAASKGVRLDLRPCRAVVHTDPVLLGRILRNLVANAVRHTERGRILIAGRRRGSRLSLEVWDTGPGIPQAEQQNVFQEFYQLGNPERDRTRGLGLGLAIVKRLANLLDCPLTLASRPGEGSVFKVSVPLSAEAAITTESMAPSASSRPGLILVIDDEIAVQEAMRSLLAGWGHQAIVAGSLAEMVERIADHPARPGLIVCDYRLRGGETGIAAIQELQSLYNEDIPALLVTGDTAPDRIKEAEASGFVLLHKPVPNETLRAAVDRALAAAEATPAS